MAKIFISYRRRDAAYVAASLSEKLQQHFGEDSIFFDIDNIPLGVDFREHIGNAVGQCDVLLVIIGEEWLTVVDKTGKRRLDDSGDFVRIEIESALKRTIPVIPILVDEALMPAAADLPESIQSIVYRNAAELRAGSDLRQHIERLIRGLEALFKLNEKPEPKEIKKEPVQKPKPTPKKKEKPPQKPKPIVQPKPKIAEPEPEVTDKEAAALMVIVKILGNFSDSYLFLVHEIPNDRLANAILSYAPGVAAKDVLLLYDNTIFGGAKDGLLLTGDAVYWHNISEGGGMARFSDIRTVTYDDGFFTSEIFVDGRAIKINMGERSKLTKILADVILNLALSIPENAVGKDAGDSLVVTSDDGSCRLSLPSGWSRQTNLNAEAKLQVGNPAEDLYGLVLREPKSDFPASTTLETYVGLIRDNLRKTLGDPQFSEPFATTVGGFLARQFEVSGTISGVNAKYLYALVGTSNNFYQVMSWTLTATYDENKAELEEVINSFQEI